GKLVPSVKRDAAAEAAVVVRSILAMLDGTRDLDNYLRCRAFVAVERASFALESHHHTNLDQIRQVLVPFEPSIAFEGLNGGGFAHKVALLDRGNWNRVSAAAPAANAEAVAPLG